MPARSINSSLISAATQPQAEPGVGPQVGKRSHPHWARAALTFASLGIIVGYRLLLLWRGGHPLFHDSDPARLFYEAFLMSRGEVIYRDFFEFAQPGVPFLYRATSTAL